MAVLVLAIPWALCSLELFLNLSVSWLPHLQSDDNHTSFTGLGVSNSRESTHDWLIGDTPLTTLGTPHPSLYLLFCSFKSQSGPEAWARRGGGRQWGWSLRHLRAQWGSHMHVYPTSKFIDERWLGQGPQRSRSQLGVGGGLLRD